MQQLQISRPDDSMLVISAEGDDRRKLPTVHTIMVPKESVAAENSDVNSKKHLRINGTSLPLELILKSVAKGGNIKIKIIDKPAQPKIQSCATMENVVELVDEDANKQGGLNLSKDSTHHLQDTTSAQGHYSFFTCEPHLWKTSPHNSLISPTKKDGQRQGMHAFFALFTNIPFSIISLGSFMPV